MGWKAMNASGAVAVPIVTALPGSPTDGQEVILADSTTAPTYAWTLRYNANAVSSYKWDFVGGSALSASDPNTFTSSSTSYTSSGLSMTLPRNGDYDIGVSAFFDDQGNATDANGFATAACTGLSALDIRSCTVHYGLGVGGGFYRTQGSSFVLFRATGLTASALTHQVRNTSGLTSGYSYRRLTATPVRVA